MLFRHTSLLLNNLFTQIRDTCLKHSQNLNNTASNHDKHEESNQTFAYRWVIGMFCCLANGDLPTFVDVFIELLLSVADASRCWLFHWYEASNGTSENTRRAYYNKVKEINDSRWKGVYSRWNLSVLGWKLLRGHTATFYSTPRSRGGRFKNTDQAESIIIPSQFHVHPPAVFFRCIFGNQ